MVILNADVDNPAPFAAFLDLQTFDNTEYDVRTPDEWLAIGEEMGVRKPIPGKALLPAKNPIYANCKCSCEVNTLNEFNMGLFIEHIQ